MRVMRSFLLGLLAVPLIAPGEVQAAQSRTATATAQSLEARIWLDRGVDPVLERGDRARVYYRASVDAHMVLFHVSTDGALRLLFPGGTDDPSRVRGGRDYRLLFPGADHWEVDESPGVGYFFVLASSEPLDFDRLSRVEVANGWASGPDRNRIRQDPYVAVDQFRQALLAEDPGAGYAIDFTAYHVGQAYSYPRFLCYQCHDAEPFEDWNPYRTACHEVRVVIYNDPYFYPASRYQGGRILFARPPEPGLPQFTFKARGVGETGVPLVQARFVDRARSIGAPPSRAVAGQSSAGGGDDTGFPIAINGGLGATLGFERAAPGNPLAPAVDPTRNQPVLSAPGAPAQDGPESRPVLRRRPSDDDRTDP